MLVLQTPKWNRQSLNIKAKEWGWVWENGLVGSLKVQGNSKVEPEPSSQVARVTW